MSKYRDWWRRVAVDMIRQYPELRKRKDEMQKVRITASFKPARRGSGAGRATEAAALRQLEPAEERIIDAVELAREEILRHRDGREVMAIVTMVDLKRTHSMTGAAMTAHMSRKTAQSRRGRFIYAFAKYYGFSKDYPSEPK